MARRKKRKEDAAAPAPQPAGDARTSLRGLLKDLVLAEPSEKRPSPPPKPNKAQRAAPPPPNDPPAARPSETLRGDDRIAWYDAYAGVRPLGAKERARAPAPVVPPPTAPLRSEGDEEARARLAALVGGGVRFDIERDGAEIRARRAGTSDAVLRALLRARPESTLDLHGMRASEAEREVVRFVRAQHRRGVRRVLIVHGKGLHSACGPVLGDVAVHALTEGGAAPVVQAFVTASHDQGGSGALLIELTR